MIITRNVEKCMELTEFGLYLLQIFQDIWPVQISSDPVLQRNLNTMVQLFHPISLANLAEMVQILNCDSAERGKAAMLVRYL